MTSVARKGAARAVADLATGTVLATVEIAAPVERVFRALTDPEEVVRWWGSPELYRTTEWISELRRGGRCRARGEMVGGGTFTVEGEYLEVDPPHKLVQTWTPDWDADHTTTLRYRLDPIPDGTRITLRHEGFAGMPESCGDHALGWERVLGWLNAHASAAPGAQAAAPQYYLCKLIAPRPTFAFDMNEAEAKVMQEHVVYWSGFLQQGIAIAFGPVADPAGPWGLGLVGVRDEQVLRELEANDPVIRAGLGFRYEALPMLRLVTKA